MSDFSPLLPVAVQPMVSFCICNPVAVILLLTSLGSYLLCLLVLSVLHGFLCIPGKLANFITSRS